MEDKLIEEQAQDDTQTSKSPSVLDSGDKTVQNLLYFRKPFSEIPIKIMFVTLVSIIWETLLISVSTLGSTIIVGAGFILLNYMEKTEEQAALGIAFSFNLIFFYGFFLALFDKLGIQCSQTFGAKQYYETKRALNQGMWACLAVFLGFTTPCFVSSYHLLVLFSIEDDVAALCHQILLYLLIANFLEMTGDFMRSACMAQGFESIFGVTSLLAVVISTVCGYIFVVLMDLGVYGWLYSKIIFEVITMAVASVIFSLVHPETRGLISFRKAMKGFKKFFFDCLKFAMGSYLEFIGYEITSIFIFLMNNQEQTAAYTAVLNIASMIYSIGETFSIICRTRMNLLIGKNLKQAAKNFYIFYIWGLMIFGIIVGSISFLLRNYVADYYAGTNPKMAEYFVTLYSVFCAAMPSELTITTSFTGIKTIGGINFLLLVNSVVFIGGNLAFALVATQKYRQGAVTLFAGLETLFYTMNFLCIARVSLTDWTKTELVLEDDEEQTPEKAPKVTENPVIETEAPNIRR